MPGVVYRVTGLFVSLCQTQCPAKETSWWLLSSGVIIPRGGHRLGDDNWHVTLCSHHPGMGWETSGSSLGTGTGSWLQSPTWLQSRRKMVPSPRHGEGCCRCRKQHRCCRWCAALMWLSRRLSGIFCSKAVDYGASCFREEV